MKDFIKNELTGWKKTEISWLLIACTIIAGLSIYWGDNLIGIISATTGVACVVCTGKGKLSAYIFGLINAVLYGMIAFKAHYYGDAMLNLCYYSVMQFVGFFTWKKHMNSETHEVEKRRMTNKGRIILLGVIALSTFVYGIILKALGGNLPYIDAFTTATSVIAMIVSIRMFAEQWWIWICVNMLSVYMWWCNYCNGNENPATLLMWIVYLGNSFIMCYKWEKEARLTKEN